MQLIQKNIYFIVSGILIVAFFAGKVLAQDPAPLTETPIMVQTDKNPDSYSNPERPTFDAQGNQYDYQGTSVPVAPTNTEVPSCQQ